MVVLIDRVTDEQVRGVTERGEWAGDGKRVGWGRKGRGLGTERERAADRRGVGWERKVCGMGMGRVWIRRGRGRGGENGRHVRGRNILS